MNFFKSEDVLKLIHHFSICAFKIVSFKNASTFFSITRFQLGMVTGVYADSKTSHFWLNRDLDSQPLSLEADTLPYAIPPVLLM